MPLSNAAHAGHNYHRPLEATRFEAYYPVMNKPHALLAEAGISISDLKKNPSAAIASADGFPLAILSRNRPTAYLVPAEAWEALMDRLEDIELAEAIRARDGQTEIEVSIADL
jgi:antitoxin StbD